MFSFAPEFNRQSRFADSWNRTQTCCRQRYFSLRVRVYIMLLFIDTLHIYTSCLQKLALCNCNNRKSVFVMFAVFIDITVSEAFWIWGTISFIHDQSLWQWALVHHAVLIPFQTLTTLKIKRCKQNDLKQRKQKQQETNKLILLINAIYSSNICHSVSHDV